MKRILLLLLLCSTTLLMAQQTDPIQEAMASYDYETALSLIAQKKPATPLLLQKGKALRSLGLNAEALSTYQEIIGKDSTNTRALIEAAECCRTLAKYKQASAYYEKVLDLIPSKLCACKCRAIAELSFSVIRLLSPNASRNFCWARSRLIYCMRTYLFSGVRSSTFS